MITIDPVVWLALVWVTRALQTHARTVLLQGSIPVAIEHTHTDMAAIAIAIAPPPKPFNQDHCC